MKTKEKILFLVFGIILMNSLAFASPQFVLVDKDISVDFFTGELIAQLTIKNIGSQSGDVLIEIQPRQGACQNPLTAFLFSYVTPQDTCDYNYPYNVHVVIKDLAPNEQKTVTLRTPKMPSGTYCVVGVSTDSCCTTNPNCVALTPFEWGKELQTITVSGNDNPKCGNHICEPNEDEKICPEDCKWCGNGYCNPIWENSQNCPADCGGGGRCGDGYCNSTSENWQNCPADCGFDIIKWLLANWYIIVILLIIIILIILYV